MLNPADLTGRRVEVGEDGATLRVLWIPYEGVSILPARLAASGVDMEIIADGIVILNDLLGRGDTIPRLNAGRRERRIWDEIEEWKRRDDSIQLVVIDSLSSGTNDVDENSKAISEPMTRLSSTAERLGISILLLHHPRKRSSDEDDEHVVNMDSIRGHSSISGVPRAIIALDMPVEGRRRMRIVKNSLAARDPAPLGNDIHDARIITSEAPIPPEVATGRSSRTTECEAWLTQILSIGERSSAEIQEMAEEEGFLDGCRPSSIEEHRSPRAQDRIRGGVGMVVIRLLIKSSKSSVKIQSSKSSQIFGLPAKIGCLGASSKIASRIRPADLRFGMSSVGSSATRRHRRGSWDPSRHGMDPPGSGGGALDRWRMVRPPGSTRKANAIIVSRRDYAAVISLSSGSGFSRSVP